MVPLQNNRRHASNAMTNRSAIYALLAALAWAAVVVATVALFAALCRLVPCQYLSFDP